MPAFAPPEDRALGRMGVEVLGLIAALVGGGTAAGEEELPFVVRNLRALQVN